jgi:hypothetical protein
MVFMLPEMMFGNGSGLRLGCGSSMRFASCNASSGCHHEVAPVVLLNGKKNQKGWRSWP